MRPTPPATTPPLAASAASTTLGLGLLWALATACGGVVEDLDLQDGAPLPGELADAGSTDAPSPDAGTPEPFDAGSVTAPGGATDAGDVMPAPLQPCANGRCWETTLGGAPCVRSAQPEDFSSGTYNVHRYASTLWDRVSTRVQVTRRAGSWQPALVITTVAGQVLFDGATGLQSAGVSVSVASGADVTLQSQAQLPIYVFVTSQATLASGFVAGIPTDATYTVSIDSDCGGTTVSCVVNGNTVREPACGWLHYVARRVVPRLPGTRAARIDAAAVVAWWSLKEGVMFLANPTVYSNCNFSTGDARIGPLDACVPNRAWQVGLSAVQVPYHTDAEVEAAARTTYPALTLERVLRDTAVEAGLDATSVDAVAASSGTLRRSWLLRNAAVGFLVEEPVVRRECIDSTRTWCYGTGWDTTRLFAPTRAAALTSINDLRALLGRVAP